VTAATDMIVSPRTGEVLTLDSSTDDLGGFLADVRDHEAQLRDVKRLVNRELVRRMDHAAKWTVHAAGLKLRAPSPKPTEEWNGAELRAGLLALVDAGDLAIEAVDAAVETVTDYKVHKAGINALRSLGGRAAAIVDELATRPPEKERYVSVERSA
jgi:hypothetical protein